MDRAGDWKRLCGLIDDDEAVWEAVHEALQAADDPWDALIGGLDDAGALAYLQVDDTGMELSDALAQLPRVFALQPDLDEVTDTDDLIWRPLRRPDPRVPRTCGWSDSSRRTTRGRSWWSRPRTPARSRVSSPPSVTRRSSEAERRSGLGESLDQAAVPVTSRREVVRCTNSA